MTAEPAVACWQVGISAFLSSAAFWSSAPAAGTLVNPESFRTVDPATMEPSPDRSA